MISKTNFLNYMECAKSLWLKLNRPELAKPLSDLDKKTIETGMQVGELARQHFKDCFNASRKNANGRIDIEEQIKATKVALELGKTAIAEASFLYEDLFCAVDILVKDGDGWSIYEVKASSNYKDEHLYDVAFQKYVLQKLGFKIISCFIMHLNKEYERHGDLDLNELFGFEEVDETKDISLSVMNVGELIPQVRELVKLKEEPNIDFTKSCKDCPFHDYCTKDLPKNNISEICGIHADVAYANINAGIITPEDFVRAGKSLKSKRQKVQLQAITFGKDRIVDKGAVDAFLSTLSYPLYHLDFETMNEGIPPFDGAHPYDQIPFQYSLHIETQKGGPYIHKEFLGEKLNCDYDLAKQLLEDIPPHACVIAYHKSTEEGIIRKLAIKYQDLHDELLKRVENILDLIVPFKNGDYYDIKQGKSNSIKYVMPALCPHMEEAYHNLPVVHNGGEALSMFPKLVKMTGKEYEDTRWGMLKYCELDTWSMVEILKVLYEEVK